MEIRKNRNCGAWAHNASVVSVNFCRDGFHHGRNILDEIGKFEGDIKATSSQEYIQVIST
jgi:hypothetical protein